MDDRTVILRCLYQNWPNEVSAAGEDLTARIVEDALSGNRPKVRVPRGGHNFDLAIDINTIIEAALLLVALLEYRMRRLMQHPKPSSPPPSTAHNSNKEEQMIQILIEYLQNEKKFNYVNAIKLARLLYSISPSSPSDLE